MPHYVVWKRTSPAGNMMTREMLLEQVQKAKDEGWQKLLTIISEVRGKEIRIDVTPQGNIAAWDIQSSADLSTFFTRHGLDFVTVEDTQL